MYRLLSEIKNGFSPIILIVGKRGMGKSFAACWLGYILSKYLGKEFDVKKNCIYDLSTSVNFIMNNHLEVMVLDEMIEMGFKREHFRSEHFDFIKILNTQRIKQIIYIMVLPFGSDLNSAIAKNVDLVFYVRKRGVYLAGKNKKRYWELIMRNEPPRFFEKIGVKMREVPKEIWKDYKEYSTESKTRISERIANSIIERRIEKERKNMTPADKLMARLNE